MDFRQQVLLALYDKLFLGAAVAGVTLLAARLLERYKARTAFASQVAKAKLDRICDLWEATLEWERTVTQLLRDSLAFTIREAVTAGARGVPPQLPADLRALAEVYGQMDRDVTVRPGIMQRYRSQFGARMQVAMQQSADLERQVHRSRFVIGQDPHRALVEYVGALKQAVRDAADDGDHLALVRRLDSVAAKRADIDRVMDDLTSF